MIGRCNVGGGSKHELILTYDNYSGGQNPVITGEVIPHGVSGSYSISTPVQSAKRIYTLTTSPQNGWVDIVFYVKALNDCKFKKITLAFELTASNGRGYAVAGDGQTLYSKNTEAGSYDSGYMSYELDMSNVSNDYLLRFQQTSFQGYNAPMTVWIYPALIEY